MEDCALTLGSIAGFDQRDPSTKNIRVPDYSASLTGDVNGLKIGLIKEFLDSDVMGASKPVVQGVMDAAALLASLGAEVEEVSLPLAPVSGVASRIISAVERSSLHPEWLRDRPDDFHHNTRVAFSVGELIPSQVYYKAQKLRTLVREQTLEALQKFDVLLMPVAPVPATIMNLNPGIESKEAAVNALTEGSYRGLFSMVSGPAMSICCGFTTEGGNKLPLALQIAGRPFDESTLMNVAYAYEQNTAWNLERPPL